MYNAQRKKEYLETIKDSKQKCKWLTSIFIKVEGKEIELEKDISEWSSSEIISYYKSLATASFNSLAMRHSRLRSYAEWCGDHLMIADNQNHYNEIDQRALQNCVNIGMRDFGLITRKEMERLNAKLLNPRDKCLVYALFEGIEGQMFSELVNLNVKQIRDGNYLELETRTVPVNRKLIDLMYESTDEYRYCCYSDSLDYEQELYFPAYDNNVFKMTPNSRETSLLRSRQRLYSNLQRIKDYVNNPAINATSLIESGRIDMIKGIMKKEPGKKLEEILKEHEKEITNKYGKIFNITKYILNYGNFFSEKNE